MKKKCYVLAYADGSLAGIDYSSGYPYVAYHPADDSGNVSGVRFFSGNNLTRARDFIKHFPELQLKEFHWQVSSEGK